MMESDILKECHLDCECQLEGHCVIDAMYPEIGMKPEDCTAKTDDDLMDEDEYEEYVKEA